MFKKDTISKLIAMLKALIAFFATIPVEKLHVSISRGNRKIGRVMNVSLPPIISCKNCKECKSWCYDIKAAIRYENVRLSRCRNWSIYTRNEKQYFDEIENAISRRRTNKYFRWHVAGYIVNMAYLENMIEIARRHPDFIFWTYTKCYFIVNEYVKKHGNDRIKAIPENMHIMFSEWDGMKLDNPYNFPIFTVKFKDGNKNHEPQFFDTLYKCPGNCDICKNGNLGCIGGMNTYVDQH